jgi:hypothetical protein
VHVDGGVMVTGGGDTEVNIRLWATHLNFNLLWAFW